MSKNEIYPTDIHKTVHVPCVSDVEKIIKVWAEKKLRVAQELGKTIGLRCHCPADDATDECPSGETLLLLKLRLKALGITHFEVEDNVVPDKRGGAVQVKTLRAWCKDAEALQALTLPPKKKPSGNVAHAKPATAVTK